MLNKESEIESIEVDANLSGVESKRNALENEVMTAFSERIEKFGIVALDEKNQIQIMHRNAMKEHIQKLNEILQYIEKKVEEIKKIKNPEKKVKAIKKLSEKMYKEFPGQEIIKKWNTLATTEQDISGKEMLEMQNAMLDFLLAIKSVRLRLSVEKTVAKASAIYKEADKTIDKVKRETEHMMPKEKKSIKKRNQ